MAAARKYLDTFGGSWELDTMPDVEVNALLVQVIASDIRENTDKVNLSEITRRDCQKEGMTRFWKVGKKYYYNIDE